MSQSQSLRFHRMPRTCKVSNCSVKKWYIIIVWQTTALNWAFSFAVNVNPMFSTQPQMRERCTHSGWRTADISTDWPLLSSKSISLKPAKDQWGWHDSLGQPEYIKNVQMCIPPWTGVISSVTHWTDTTKNQCILYLCKNQGVIEQTKAFQISDHSHWPNWRENDSEIKNWILFLSWSGEKHCWFIITYHNGSFLHLGHRNMQPSVP